MIKFLKRLFTFAIIVAIAFALGLFASRAVSCMFFGGTLLGGNPF